MCRGTFSFYQDFVPTGLMGGERLYISIIGYNNRILHFVPLGIRNLTNVVTHSKNAKTLILSEENNRIVDSFSN